jgi:hypothetical protein
MLDLLVLALAPTFLDKTADLGVAHPDSEACWVDVDQDGWVDLVAGGAIWLNRAGKRFEKMATPDVGAVVAADFDNDGYPDLFSWSQMKLYHNDGGKGFTEIPIQRLLPTVSRGACSTGTGLSTCTWAGTRTGTRTSPTRTRSS